MEPLRLLLDVGAGAAVLKRLRELGHDVLAIAELDPRASDLKILELARKEDRIIITLDKDFGELVFHEKRAHAGVLLLRMEDARGAEKADLMEEIIQRFGSMLAGSFVVYQSGLLRFRDPD